MKRCFAAALLGFLLLAVAGCSLMENTMSMDQPVLYTVQDSRGKTLAFREKPKRIVCCQVFVDEILLDLVSHDRIAGLSRWVHDPDLSSAAAEAADVKQIVEPNTESIIGVHPDLVILGNNSLPLAETLEDAGLPVYVVKNTSQLEEIDGMIASVAAAVDEPEKGRVLQSGLAADLQQLAEDASLRLPKEKVLLFLRFGGIGGEGTIYHEALTAVGLEDGYNSVREKDAMGTAHSMILSKEEVIHCNPSLLIMANWTQGGACQDSQAQLQAIYEDPAFVTVEAVKRHRACIIPQRYVNCMSHHAGKNLIKMAGLLKTQLQEQQND